MNPVAIPFIIALYCLITAVQYQIGKATSAAIGALLRKVGF